MNSTVLSVCSEKVLLADDVVCDYVMPSSTIRIMASETDSRGNCGALMKQGCITIYRVESDYVMLCRVSTVFVNMTKRVS